MKEERAKEATQAKATTEKKEPEAQVTKVVGTVLVLTA